LSWYLYRWKTWCSFSFLHADTHKHCLLSQFENITTLQRAQMHHEMWTLIPSMTGNPHRASFPSHPSSLLPSTIHTVTIWGAKDSDGTHDLTHAKHTLHHWAIPLAPELLFMSPWNIGMMVTCLPSPPEPSKGGFRIKFRFLTSLQPTFSVFKKNFFGGTFVWILDFVLAN
jgi:hypothetical protein